MIYIDKAFTANQLLTIVNTTLQSGTNLTEVGRRQHLSS